MTTKTTTITHTVSVSLQWITLNMCEIELFVCWKVNGKTEQVKIKKKLRMENKEWKSIASYKNIYVSIINL